MVCSLETASGGAACGECDLDMSGLQMIWEFIKTLRLRDAIDILLVALLIYYVALLLRRTRAVSLINGIILILVLFLLSTPLPTLNWLLGGIAAVGVVALVVVFQPELRMALERLGRGGLLGRGFPHLEADQQQNVISNVVDAAVGLGQKRIGALIVLERQTGLFDVTRTGKTINGRVSVDLLHTIFWPGTPLHDGAVVIRGGQIVAAACILPHSDSRGLSISTGMRHRAALGLAERTDAVCIVVSEETGQMSLAADGALSPRIERPQLTERLLELLETERERGWFFFRRG